MSNQGENNQVMYLIVLILMFLGCGGAAYLFYSDTIRTTVELEKVQRGYEAVLEKTTLLTEGETEKEEDLKKQLEMINLPVAFPKTMDLYFYHAYINNKPDLKRLIADYLGNRRLGMLLESNRREIVRIKELTQEYNARNRLAMKDIINAYNRTIPFLPLDRIKPLKEAMKGGGRFPYYLPKGEWTKKHEETSKYVASLILGNFPYYDEAGWAEPAKIAGSAADGISYYIVNFHLRRINCNWEVTMGDLRQYLKIFPPGAGEMMTRPEDESPIEIHAEKFFSTPEGKALLPEAVATIVVLGPRLYKDHMIYGSLFLDDLYQGASMQPDQLEKGFRDDEKELYDRAFRNRDLVRGLSLPRDIMQEALKKARTDIEEMRNDTLSDPDINDLFNKVKATVDGVKGFATGPNDVEAACAKGVWSWVVASREPWLKKIAETIDPENAAAIVTKLKELESISSIAHVENAIAAAVAEKIYSRTKKGDAAGGLEDPFAEKEKDPVLGEKPAGATGAPGPLASQRALDELKARLVASVKEELDKVTLKDWASLRKYKYEIGAVIARFLAVVSKSAAMDIISDLYLPPSIAAKIIGEDAGTLSLAAISVVRKSDVLEALNVAWSFSGERRNLVKKVQMLKKRIEESDQRTKMLAAEKAKEDREVEKTKTESSDFEAMIKKKKEKVRQNIIKVNNDIEFILHPPIETDAAEESGDGDTIKLEAGLVSYKILIGGNILKVDRDLMLVFIDIGKEHRVKEGMIFQVFILDHLERSTVKGVIKITKPYSGYSLGKIVSEYTDKEPISTKDFVGSPFYNKSRPLRFAKIGECQGLSDEDLQLLMKRFDNLADDKVSKDTDFIVIGNKPISTRGRSKLKMQKLYEEGRSLASKYKIPLIPLKDFMIYNPDKY